LPDTGKVVFPLFEGSAETGKVAFPLFDGSLDGDNAS
jgi:hypothetical protein